MIFILFTLSVFSLCGSDRAADVPGAAAPAFEYNDQSAGYRRMQAICSGQAQVEFDRELFFGVNVTSKQIVEHLIFETTHYQNLEMMQDDAMFLKIKSSFLEVFANEFPLANNHLWGGSRAALDHFFGRMEGLTKTLKNEGLPAGNVALQTLLGHWVSMKNVMSFIFVHKGSWEPVVRETDEG